MIGPNRVFIDQSLDPGMAFEHGITSELKRDGIIVLVLIGPAWATVTNSDNRPRILQSGDSVAQEIAIAMAGHIPIVPLLLDGANMPTLQDVPPFWRICRRETLQG